MEPNTYGKTFKPDLSSEARRVALKGSDDLTVNIE